MRARGWRLTTTGRWVSTPVHGGPTGFETGQQEKCVVPPRTHVRRFYRRVAKEARSPVAPQQQDLFKMVSCRPRKRQPSRLIQNHTNHCDCHANIGRYHGGRAPKESVDTMVITAGQNAFPCVLRAELFLLSQISLLPLTVFHVRPY